MTLCPPYHQDLSDELVTTVIERTIPRKQRPHTDNKFICDHGYDNPKSISHPTIAARDTFEYGSTTIDAERNLALTTSMHHLQPPWYPYPVQGKSITPRSTGPDTLLSQSYDLKLSLNGIVAAKKENRRLRGRINQRRYRKNQAKKIMGMQHDITLLRQEIDMYTMRLSVPWGNLVVNPKAWGIVAEYYCFVGRGISVSGSPTSSATHPNTMIRSQYPVETVLQYFQTILIPRVISSAGVGIEAHLEEWKTLSAIFPDFNMNIVRMEEGSSGEVVVTSKAVLSFSEKAFRSANSAADKLLGRKLKIFTVAHFIWDTTVARVAEIRFQADMISPLLRVLGSLDLVANIFSSARVSPEGQIIVA